MSENGLNTTSISAGYDYSVYYGLDEYDYSPSVCLSDDVKDFAKVFLPTLYSVVFILGFLGNGLVVCVLLQHRHQTNLTDICLFNLAVADLVFVLTLPFYAHLVVVGQWTFGGFMCRLASGFHRTGFFSSIFFMVVMTLDRYAVIMHAHSVARYRTARAGMVLTAVVWVLSLSVSLPDVIFTKVTNESWGRCSYTPENEDWKLFSLISTNILGLVIPLLVMVVCYTRIIPTLVKLRSSKKHRVVKLVISIVAVFFLFWAPYNIALFLHFLKSKSVLQGVDCTLASNLKLSITVTETLAYTHCCLNPIIYAFVGQKFMKRVLQLLRKWMHRSPFLTTGDFSYSPYWKSSVSSRTSVTSTFIS